MSSGAHHLALELDGAAAHEVPEVPDPRHGRFAAPELPQRASRYQSRRRRDWPVHGQDAETLQWGVSRPEFMDSLVAIVPLAKTPAWTVTVLEETRKTIMLDPAWKNGEYNAQPEQGMRLWRDCPEFPCRALAGGLARSVR